MPNYVRGLVATAISATRPSLFYFKADPQARRGIRVKGACESVDVVNVADGRTIRLSRANAVYIPDMIESFDYFHGSADAVTARVRGRLLKLVDFSTPRLHNVTGFSDFPVLCPSLTEPYGTTEQYLEFANLSEGDIAIDLGSYSGLTSIAFSKAVGASGKVIALEPDPLNYACVEHNIATHVARNGIDNIVLLPAAASPTSGTLRLSSEGAMGSALTSIVGSYRGETIEVESVSLADLVKRQKLPRVDFIKMDIEGAELALITESTDFFAKHLPRMVIEPHAVEGRLTSEPILRCLGQLGYTCSVIEQHGMSLPLITASPPRR